ncbi:MAG: glycosyltransferase family 2 protein [Methanobacteriota archaeon]|nr:MAG: glycosyltransferase family 2 protein [Euryarchaeota archaeon]
MKTKKVFYKPNGSVAVIPAYNEEKFIESVVRSSKRFVDLVIVVDDGSNDKTAQKARLAGAMVVKHGRRKGLGEALRTGFSYALGMGFKFVVTLDGDGQHRPEEIPKVLAPIVRGEADLVVGARVDRENMPKLRRISNMVSSRIVSHVCGHQLRDTQSGFRAWKSWVLTKLRFSSSGMAAVSEIFVDLASKGLRIVEVPIETRYGREKSYFRVVRDSLGFLAMIMLRVFGWEKAKTQDNS